MLAALLLMTISLGVGGSASADPGNGNGAGDGSVQGSGAAAAAAPAPATSAQEAAPTAPDKSRASSHTTSGTAGTSGDVSSPQPRSRADQNTGGANGDCGSYCSTRDGSPSANGDPKGTGGGRATGKPCAGCVGKADNKNPPGQYKDGSDRNAGYECDRNQGIGKTNPAHTGCTTSSSTPECQPKPGQNADCTTPPSTQECQPKPGQNADCTTPTGTTGCVVTPTSTCSTPECVGSATVSCHDEELCVPSAETTCAFDNLGEEGSRGPVANQANEGTGAARAPVVLGTEAFRPAATAAQPTQGVLPSTGASSLLDLLAATGLGLLLFGGATLALRRRTQA